uniref:Putative secreted protein n=1 Tax=Anopheles darlingi TaxID=43151 RepID=A0A2M4DDX0_ANODA
MASAPFIYLALVVIKYSGGWCFTLVFIAELLLNLTWSIVADILLVRLWPKKVNSSSLNSSNSSVAHQHTPPADRAYPVQQLICLQLSSLFGDYHYSALGMRAITFGGTPSMFKINRFLSLSIFFFLLLQTNQSISSYQRACV